MNIKTDPRRFAPEEERGSQQPCNTSRLVRQGNRGFTLMEIMIATGIMVTAVTFLLASLFSLTTLTEYMDRGQEIDALITALYEEVKALSYEELVIFQTPQVADFRAGESIEVMFLDEDQQEVPLPLEDGFDEETLPDPVEVRIRLTWEAPDGRFITRVLSAKVNRS